MLEENTIKKPFWSLSIKETLEALNTNKSGLTEEDVLKRKKRFGKNSIQVDRRATSLKILLSQFKSPLIFILLIAGLIMVLIKDYTDAIVIFAAAVINALLGFYQENKAEQALAHLKSYIEERIRVVRANREYEIETSNLVPGDIIYLSQGNRVPADARLIFINNFMVDEAILTGEALPENKGLNPVNFNTVIGDRKSMVFKGTLVVQGFANAVVTATGEDTELGHIAYLVRGQQEEQTPLQKKIISLSIKVSIFIAILVAVIFAIGTALNYPPLEMFFMAVALMVSAIPEGLPVAMTVILAIGVQRLAKNKGVIRKLLAAETLGDTTVILTDKTGTLTEAKISLSNVMTFSGNKKFNKDFILKFALANSDAIVENHEDNFNEWRIVGRPLEVALIKSAAKIGILIPNIKETFKVVDYLPFDSSAKYTASIIHHKNKKYLSVFGAADILLKMSIHSQKEKEIELKNIHKTAASGERVLGVAIKELSEKEEIHLLDGKFQNLLFLGTISFSDPIRAGVKEAIWDIEKIGIKTVIVTGDHRGTAEAIAKELGFDVGKNNVIEGDDLDNMSIDTLRSRLPFLRVVSRVSPGGKLKIAKAYQEIGEVVAMTGDGINDAPCLKQANIGIAMGSGTDVAHDVADLVILDDNFKTIVNAIEEGRRIIENIRKVLIYLISDLFDELFLIGGAIVLGMDLPLNAIQILWVNFFTNSFPAIALAFENHADYLKKKIRKAREGLIDKEMKFLISIVALPTSILLFSLYVFLLKLGYDPQLVKTFIFMSFGTWSLFLIFSIRSLQKNIWQFNFFSNPQLLIGVGMGLVSMAAAIYLPIFQSLLNTVSLPPIWLLGTFVVGFLNIVIIELGKFILKWNNK